MTNLTRAAVAGAVARLTADAFDLPENVIRADLTMLVRLRQALARVRVVPRRPAFRPS